MPQPSFELFRFCVARAARPMAAPPQLAAPAEPGFVRVALERARERPRPPLAKVAGDHLATPAAAAWIAGTPLTGAARDLCLRLQAIDAAGAGLEPALRAAMADCGFAPALAAQDAAIVRDELWSVLTALHCAPAGDAGVLLALSCTARALALDQALAAGSVPAPGALLRAPLALPLSQVCAAWAVPADEPAPGKPTLDQQVRRRKLAEAQKLLALRDTLDRVQRIVHDRRYGKQPVRHPDEPLTAAERAGLGEASLAILAALGADGAPLGSVVGETEAAMHAQAARLSAAGHRAAKPVVRALRSRAQHEQDAAATLLRLQSDVPAVALDPATLGDLIRSALPDIVLLPDTDALTEGLLPRIRPVGVLDLKLVETQLRAYQLGEIAHIENVLASEYRKREHTRQDTTEESILVEQETRHENERSLETTERFELRNEVGRTISEKMQVTAGVQVSAGGAGFTFGANAGFAYSRSQDDAKKVSAEFAKEVVDKTREKVETRVRHVRQSMNRIVLDERNTHCFDNTAPASTHVVGVYRFVDKLLDARLLNYGRRMMFEFMVPEPGAALRNVERQTSSKPQAVPELTIGPEQLDERSYQAYVGQYGAREVRSPPPAVVVATALLKRDAAAGAAAGTPPPEPNPVLLSGEITIPPGYAATAFTISVAFTGHTATPTVDWCVGEFDNNGRIVVMPPGGTQRFPFPAPLVTDKLPARVLFGTVLEAVASVAIECQRQPGHWQLWQNETFGKIKEAYELRVADVQEANRRLESQQRRGVGAANPAANRRRERDELTRGCINAFNSMLLQGNYFDALQVDDAGVLTDVDDALREGQVVRFFHAAFDWDQMTYELYPYFWGNRERWAEMMLASHEDPKFEEFLRSGFSRVMVPVRPGEEIAALNFLKLGLQGIFDGTREAVVDDPEFLQMLADLDEPLEPPVQEGEPWQVVLPTTLVKLQLPGEEEGLGMRGTA